MRANPETPEGVALELMREILERDKSAEHGNRHPRETILELYCACLRATTATDWTYGNAIH